MPFFMIGLILWEKSIYVSYGRDISLLLLLNYFLKSKWGSPGSGIKALPRFGSAHAPRQLTLLLFCACI